MSTNPYYRFMLNCAGVREKEPFFQRAWGKVNILSRQRDRQIYTDLRGSNFELQNSHNKSVLNSFNSMTIQHDHAALLEDLAAQTLHFIEQEEQQARERAREAVIKSNAIHEYIAKIVETLSPYAGLVNTAVGHTELYTVLTGPEIIVEPIKVPGAHDSFEYRKDFRARFSTRTWSLLFRGIEGRIDIFLLPVDKVLRLTKVESFYKPVARIFAEVEADTVHWTVEGMEMDANQRMAFILKLFHQLLELTRSQMFRERGQGNSINNEILDLTISKVAFNEDDDTRDFDYRKGQPALFGANESANSSSLVEPSYVEAAIVQTEIIDLTDFNRPIDLSKAQHLLTESDLEPKSDCKAEKKRRAVKDTSAPAKKTSKSVKSPKKSTPKDKAAGTRGKK